MSNHKNLLFFNKEGDNLNFNYNTTNDRFEGSILFHENSSDTFKTACLYVLEDIPSFDYEYIGELYLNKFQLFNEYGFDFYNGNYVTQSITKIEPINNDPSFYSKWVYGEQFNKLFPIGTIIRFDSSLLEFTNPLQTYPVVATKDNAILIISAVDNATFETNFSSQYIYDSTYVGKSISAINAIGVYNYIDSAYKDNLSTWNEPTFYEKLYKRKKLNVINTSLNDGTYTVTEENLTDSEFFKYYVDTLSNNQDLIAEIISKTDLPKIYEGALTIQYIAGSHSVPSVNKLVFGSSIPEILKPGKEFKIIGSINNENFLTVATIPQFLSNTQQNFYDLESQVLYNNKIYECIQAYTQSFADDTTKYITPENTSYWTNTITYIKVDQQVTPETIANCQLYLTTNKLYLQHSWTQSSIVTLSSAAQKWEEDLRLYNVEIFYENNTLYADLMYPGNYVEINFYEGLVSPTASIGNVSKIYEKVIQVEETIQKELNYDFSAIKSINIVFTDLDEYGLKLIINDQVYEEEISWIYSGSSVDMERTIDRTLRSWLLRNYLSLQKLGIIAELQYIGNYTSPFYNSIKLRTEYPNVDMIIKDILVGSTAHYYLEHSRVLFHDIGGYLSITINDDVYSQVTIYQTGTYSMYPDIPATLQSWVDEHSDYLENYGIYVSNIHNLLTFNTKYPDRRLEYQINTGKSWLPGIPDYTITEKVKGNLGVLITSNEVKLSDSAAATFSFEQAGFATGMAFSINNTYRTWNNTEYNIQFLDPGVMNLSYQGPFWGTRDRLCETSPFITLAFDYGFGQTGCTGATGGPTSSLGGPFDKLEFNNAFRKIYNLNTYITNIYNLNSYSGSSNLSDITYLQLSNSIYGLGDSLIVIDASLAIVIDDVALPGNTQSQFLRFNTVNNYLYCVSKGIIYVVDPLLNNIVTSWTYTTEIIKDVQCNPVNGDMYITFENANKIEIRNYNNAVVSTLTVSGTSTGKMIFNNFESDMYVVTDKLEESVLRIDGTLRTLETVYGYIPGAASLYYEPVEESIYVLGSTNLWKIDNGVTASIPVITGSFSDIIYNNITSEMNLSDSSTLFRGLNLIDDSVRFSTSIGNYGYLALNQYDGDVYLSSKLSNSILVLNPENGNALYSVALSSQADKIIYNPERKSIWTIQPSENSIVEVEVRVNTVLEVNPNGAEVPLENSYGTLSPSYSPHREVWLKSKEYLRRPRENFTYETSVEYYWKWYSDNAPEFFLYDFSGDQLETTGSYVYTGVKPLETIVLNKTANSDISKVSYPEYQQTIFDEIHNTLEYIDDEDITSIEPEPIQIFIGFKSEDEGAIKSILQLYKREDISLTYISSSLTNITFETIDQDSTDKRGYITIDTYSSENFTEKGLKEGQIIAIYVKDNTNLKNQYISNNNGTIVKIRNVFFKRLVIDFVSTNDFLFYENTVVNNYPTNGSTTYLTFDIEVLDREIGRFTTYGQTEIEDIRFKIELGNVGKLVAPNEVFIFKEYDILEGGIDWTILNKKRKEMLMMRHLIYPYIGAYKSIINAINFFGYNDLKLNEYYRNVNPTSEKFLKLFKVEIPDIFDNTVEGWSDNDFVNGNFPNDDYQETKMFNLTYDITDKDGNNTINYSIDEIIIKLQGLKYWLKRNIIPLTHKILDITGQSYFKHQNQITHTSYDIKIVNMYQNMTPISFKLNEAYLMPINSGSTVYNCVVDFYSIIDEMGADKNPTGLIEPPTPYNNTTLELPDYFDISIRTYKTYIEWYPFTTYNIGDKISYYSKVYESQIDNNRVNNPRKYENASSWVENYVYEPTSIISYERDIFVCKSTISITSSASPIVDTTNWLKVTEWKEINYEPVQTIKEFRKIPKNTTTNPILPFNFTVDSNIDPLIAIEVTSDNGYGLIYRDKKNYEIKGLKDITQPVTYVDNIGPFQPITPFIQ